MPAAPSVIVASPARDLPRLPPSSTAQPPIDHDRYIAPCNPGERLALGKQGGKKEPLFRTKPQLGLELVERAVGLGVPFRAVAADCLYGESRAFERALWQAGLPYVVALKPSKGVWERESEVSPPISVQQEP